MEIAALPKAFWAGFGRVLGERGMAHGEVNLSSMGQRGEVQGRARCICHAIGHSIHERQDWPAGRFLACRKGNR